MLKVESFCNTKYFVVKFEKETILRKLSQNVTGYSIDEDGVTCAWPSARGRKLQDVIRRPEFPDDNWKTFSVTILRKCGM